MAQLKAILNQLEMNLKNSEKRFQVAPHKKQWQQTERGGEGEQESRELWQVVFSHAARTSQMSAHHFDGPYTQQRERGNKKEENEKNLTRRRRRRSGCGDDLLPCRRTRREFVEKHTPIGHVAARPTSDCSHRHRRVCVCECEWETVCVRARLLFD